jgi:hypothetical protein
MRLQQLALAGHDDIFAPRLLVIVMQDKDLHDAARITQKP